jgi:nitroimidazol reductase NimA-like FMN-containing flavoprotein (pyridoxamine 5'-phosphate oxidase superfamily)
MTIATNRPDGWPQATIVGYSNDELVIYAVVGRTGQKFANVSHDPRVSIAIGKDSPEPMEIEGLSMAARAEAVADPAEIDRATSLLFERYPEYKVFMTAMHPDVTDMVFLRIVPDVVSILDYSKGFGHTDLVPVSAGDL